MTLLSEIQAAQASLESTRRRKGVVTLAVLRDALPPTIRNLMSVHQMADVVADINDALREDSEPYDSKAKAAGDA